MNYKSDIVLGERYRDEQTGIEGIATAIYFFQHACERAQIEYVNEKDGELKELVFDSPRLIHMKSGKQAKTDRPGGPARNNEGRRPGL
jgi:hypothetical protein